MAIENTYLLGKNITLGCGFDLQAKAPLDSRQTVPAFAGLQALIDNNAAYEGMIVYDEETKKTYQAQMVDDVLAFREFGINEAELKDLIASETTAAMEFKGAANALPENPAKGDMYKVTTAFKVGEEDAKVGDSIVYDGEQWFIIPSGDDIEDTWRPVTGVDNDATLTFAAGDKLEKTVAADGTITYKHAAIDAPANMNAEDDERTRTYITQLITDNHGHIIGFKTATENVEDTNTTYEFEGQSDEATSVYFQVKSSDAEAAEVVYLNAYSKNEADAAIEAAKTEAANQDAVVLGEAQKYADAELAKKVDKVEGYSLVADVEIARLAEVDNYDDEEVRGLIADNAKAIEDHEALASQTYETKEDAAQKLVDAKAYTDEQIGAKVEELELGTMSKETADDYVKKSDATGFGDILTKTEAQGAYQPKGDYATAAQGAKADTAIQDLMTSSGLGHAVEIELEKTAIPNDDGQEWMVNIQADVIEGGIETKHIADKNVTKDKLADDVRASLALADSALQAHQDISHLATTEALNGVDAKFAQYTNTTDMNAKFDLKADKTQIATDIATAKEEVLAEATNQDAVVLAEAQSYTNQAIATVEGSVNALVGNVYTKEQTYTQEEVNALLSAAQTWGEF